jgi:hypothetical protein
MKNTTFFLKILVYLKAKTKIDYEKHVIEEIGHYGPILSLLSDCDKHARTEEGMVTKWTGDCLWRR